MKATSTAVANLQEDATSNATTASEAKKSGQRWSIRSKESNSGGGGDGGQQHAGGQLVHSLLKTLSEDGSNEGDVDWKPEIPFGNVS